MVTNTPTEKVKYSLIEQAARKYLKEKGFVNSGKSETNLIGILEDFADYLLNNQPKPMPTLPEENMCTSYLINHAQMAEIEEIENAVKKIYNNVGPGPYKIIFSFDETKKLVNQEYYNELVDKHFNLTGF